MSPGASPTGETQTRLLDAGVRLWADESPAVVLGGFTVARVAKAAGVTRATFYSYWPTTEAYLVDLVDHLIRRGHPALDAEISEIYRHINDPGPDVLGHFMEINRMILERTARDPGLRLRMGFLAHMDDDKIADRLREMYRTLEKSGGDEYATLLDSTARTTRDPLTRDQLRAISMAILEMFAARHVIDPELFPADLYGLVSMTLIIVLTRQFDDQRSAYSIFESVNAWRASGFVARATQMAAERDRTERPISPPGTISAETAALEGDRTTVQDDRSLVPAMIRQVVIAARRLTARAGWSDLHLGEIALITGITEEVLVQTFGSKAGIAEGIVEMNIHERLSALPTISDPITRLRAMLNVCAEELRRSPALTQSIVMIFAGSSTRPLKRFEWSPTPLVLATALEAQKAGQLDPDLDVPPFIASLMRILLVDNRPHASGPPGMTTAEFVLRGAGAPPPQPAHAPAPAPAPASQ